MKFKELTQKGFSHIVVPLIVVVLIAAGGTYYLVATHADTIFGGCTAQGTETVSYKTYTGQTGSYRYNYYPKYSTANASTSIACVKSLQAKVNQYCTPDTALVADGYYGAKTALAVKNVQYSFTTKGSSTTWLVNGSPVSVDGVAGPQTWGVIQVYTNPYGTSASRGGIACNYPR